MDLQNNFVLVLCLVLVTWNAIAAFSEEHVAKLVMPRCASEVYGIVFVCLSVCLSV